MSHASIVAVSPMNFEIPALPSLAPWFRRAAKAGAFALQSACVAGVLWLILAGPGFVSERHSVVAAPRVSAVR